MGPGKNDDTSTSAVEHETLRRKLRDITNGRAEMEREYMNLLSSVENEKRTMAELLRARERERDSLNGTVSSLKAEVKDLRSLNKSEKIVSHS